MTTINESNATASYLLSASTTPNATKVRHYGLDTVNISFLPNAIEGTTNNNTKSTLPLLITPRWDSSLRFITEWCQQNQSFLQDAISKHGALLLRGFDIDNATDMQDAFQSIISGSNGKKLNATYRGTSPRNNPLQGTEYVFSAAEVPAHYPIAQHLEMSFLDAPPRYLFFACLQPSQAAGGETSLCDFRKLAADLPVDLRNKFLTKGIKYIRTHRKTPAKYTYDVSDMVSWPQLFHTHDKKEVERLCQAEGMPCSWDENDSFVSVTTSDAFQRIAANSGDGQQQQQLTWFNHAQVFHWTTSMAELWFSVRRTRDVRLLFHCILVTIFSVIKYGLLGHRMGLHVEFGDGTPITASEMNVIRKTIHKHLVFSRWQRGDVLYIDNFAVSHGRQPTYDGGRKIAVAWSDPEPKKNATVVTKEVAAAPATTNICNDSNDPPVQYSMANPQERTPESTLTKTTAEKLNAELLQQITCIQKAFERHDTTAATVDNHNELQKGVSMEQSQPPLLSSDFWKTE